MTENDGIFTVSDLAGTDPHALLITGLPNAPQPHVWETPYDPFAANSRLMFEQAQIDAATDRGLMYAGLNPYTLAPLYPQSPAPAGPRQYNMNGLRASWAFNHPVRAFFVRLGLRHNPSDQELIRDWS